MHASDIGDIEVVRELIKRKAYFNSKNNNERRR